MLQIYIRPSLRYLLQPRGAPGEGLYRLHVKDVVNRSAVALMMAIRDRWPWRVPGEWQQATLLLHSLGFGWFAIVSVDVVHGLSEL